MGEFNRTISNRVFAAFLSILLMFPTGWGLFTYWKHDSSTDKKDLLSQLFVHAVMDVVAVAFAISLLGIIWALFLPGWIGRFFKFMQQHLEKALAVFVFVVLFLFVF